MAYIPEILKFTSGPKPLSAQIYVKASQGNLKKGCPMAYLDNESGWVPYAHGQSDGSQTPLGILAHDLENNASAQPAPMFLTGAFTKSVLVDAGLTANAISAFSSRLTDVPGLDLIILR